MMKQQSRIHSELQLAFLSSLKDEEQHEKIFGPVGKTVYPLPGLPELRSLEYTFRLPSREYLLTVYNSLMAKLAPLMDAEVTRHTAVTAKGDHFHKLPGKGPRTKDGVKIVDSLFAVLNEQAVVIQQFFVITTVTLKSKNAGSSSAGPKGSS